MSTEKSKGNMQMRGIEPWFFANEGFFAKTPYKTQKCINRDELSSFYLI
jgi:hypothetical protein